MLARLWLFDISFCMCILDFEEVDQDAVVLVTELLVEAKVSYEFNQSCLSEPFQGLELVVLTLS